MVEGEIKRKKRRLRNSVAERLSGGKSDGAMMVIIFLMIGVTGLLTYNQGRMTEQIKTNRGLVDNVEDIVHAGGYEFYFVTPRHPAVRAQVTGRYSPNQSRIYIETYRSPKKMATTCRHEILHAFWPGQESEHQHNQIYNQSSRVVQPICDQVMYWADYTRITTDYLK